MSASVDNDTSSRKRRWDDSEDGADGPPAGAAGAADAADAADVAASAAPASVSTSAKRASPPAEAPAKRRAEKAYTADVDINDSANRQSLAKSSTHRSITDATDAEVTTRGRYYADPTHATPADPALHLHIEAYTKESLDQAVAMVERLKAETLADSTADHKQPVSPGGSGYADGDGDHGTRIARQARPGSAAGSASGGYARLQDKVYVDIESERGFNVRAKLIGTGGENMKYIQNTTGARVQVRGRGSGYNDREGNVDPYEPMYLYVSAGSEEALAQAKGYCQSLIDTIRNQYYEFKQTGSSGGRRHYDGHSHGGGRDGRDYGHGYSQHQSRHDASYQHGRSHQRTRNHQGGRGHSHAAYQQGSPAYYDSVSPAAGYGQQYPQQQQQQQYGAHGYEAGQAVPPATATPTSADASAYGDYSDYYAQYYQYYGTYPDYSAYYGTAEQTASETTAQPVSEPTTDTDKKSAEGVDSPSSNGYHSVPPPASYANGNNKTRSRNESKDKSGGNYHSTDPLSIVLNERRHK